MERLEPPTPSRLQELREQGIVHYSPAVAALASILAVAASVVALEGRFFEFTAEVRALTRGDLPTMERLAPLAQKAIWLLLVPAIAAGSGRLVVLLVQTRFLFIGDQIGLRLARLSPWYPPRQVRRDPGVLGRLLLPLLFICVATSGSFYLVRDIMTLSRQSADQLGVWFFDFISATIPYLTIAAIVLIPFCWILSRLLFMIQFRMSSAEIEKQERAER